MSPLSIYNDVDDDDYGVRLQVLCASYCGRILSHILAVHQASAVSAHSLVQMSRNHSFRKTDYNTSYGVMKLRMKATSWLMMACALPSSQLPITGQ